LVLRAGEQLLISKAGFSESQNKFSMDLPPTPEKSLIQAKEIAEKAGIKYIYIGNIPSVHEENTYCPQCKRMILERISYTIIKNNIDDGKCEFCKTPIAGVWK
jgi:pyruvate formate lyase activating enzyme